MREGETALPREKEREREREREVKGDYRECARRIARDGGFTGDL